MIMTPVVICTPVGAETERKFVLMLALKGIEDFMQLRGEHKIADGKLKVRYDILAPNFRTIQKTWDLTGFWQNTYAEVRKELRGRYPKHPWPESVEP